MKKLFFVLVFALVSASVHAQSHAFNAFQRQHAGHDATFSFGLNGTWLRLLARASGEKDAQVWLQGVRHASVVCLSERAAHDLTSLKAAALAEAFDELMTVRSGKDHVLVLVKERGGIVSDALLLMRDNTEAVVVCLRGEMSLRDIAQAVRTAR